MGLFDFLKKKDTGRDNSAGPSTRLRMGEPSRLDTEMERARQREIARETTAKINAIESAMAKDIFNEPEPAWGARRPPRTSAQVAADAAEAAAAAGPDTMPNSLLAHTELLGHNHPPALASLIEPATAPVVDEIAILFANNELDIAQHMLQDSLADVGGIDRTVWWMLFDLYHVTARQDAFEDLSIDYASRFETSPPNWAPLVPVGSGADANSEPYAGITPTEAFGPVLDDSIAPQLQRLLELAATRAASRLEFSSVRAVSAEGCARLLQALTVLRGGKRELIVVGANELADIVRAGLVIGARDAPEAPWLLLLELLQLMNREKDFEETAMDYCVTYELSPPQFEAPVNVASAAPARPPSRADRFMLPPVIEGNTTPLFNAIDAYAAHTDVVVLDGSRLGRVDYAAATVLHQRLRALAAQDKTIELREINHLVAALFKLMGYGDAARVYPHKY